MEGNDWSAVDPRLTPIGFQESYREYVHISEHIEARQWRVLLEWSGFPAPFVVFQNPLLPRLVYTQFYSVVSLTASHDSRWNAKNTVEGFSSPLFLSPLAISSSARLSSIPLHRLLHKPLASCLRDPELEEFSRRRRSFQLPSMPTRKKENLFR